MQPHQQRVVEEKEALDVKIDALCAFIDENPIYQKLDIGEQGRLYAQVYAMRLYSEILQERIDRF
jgi:hypothetical protein